MTRPVDSDYPPADVANIWMEGSEVHGTFSHTRTIDKFDNVNDWKEHKVFEDMCSICNGSKSDHFPGCPNDWLGVWD